jgi:hypothetical protein
MRAQSEAQEQLASLPPVSLPDAEPDISRTTVTELLPSVSARAQAAAAARR